MTSHAPLSLGMLLLIVAASASAQPTGQLQQKLDARVNFSIKETPIREVFRKLSEATGVDFEVSDDAVALLPYDEQTRLSVTLKDITLRKALTPVLAAQGLRWEVRNGKVLILPAEPLYRTGRRVNYDELHVIGVLCKEKLASGEETSPVDQLRKLTDNDQLRIIFPVGANGEKAMKTAAKILPATGQRWLNRLCEPHDWTWYIWSDEIRIVPRAEQVRRQLQTEATLAYKNADIAKVLLELSNAARVSLEMDPGVLKYLPTETRENFNLLMGEATVAQAFEVISGATGLQFVPTNEGVQVRASEQLRASIEPRQRKRSPFFVRMSIPVAGGAKVDVFLRPDELSDELKSAVERERDRLFEALRKRLNEGLAATQPVGTR